MNLLERLKYRLFRKKLANQPQRQISFPNYEQVKTILLLYKSDLLERNLYIKDLVKNFQEEGKTIITWGFVDKKVPASPILPQSRILGYQSQTLWGDLQDNIKQELQEQTYDLMIDLTQEPCLALHYVAFYAKSHFKAGKRIEDGLLDLMIEMPSEESEAPLFEQVMHYLHTIKSND